MNWVETFSATLFLAVPCTFDYLFVGYLGFADYSCTIVNSRRLMTKAGNYVIWR